MSVTDWDRRELCPDGNCTGLIGPDGTCRGCGRAAPDEGGDRRRGGVDDATGDAGDADADAGDLDAANDAGAPPLVRPVGSAARWTERSLCPDGSCIGLIGPTGTCKVCGKVGVPGGADAGLDAGSNDDDEYDEDEDDDDEYEDGEGYEDAADGDESDADDEAYEDAQDAALAAAAADLAGVATTSELAGAGQLADAADPEGDRRLCPDGSCVGLVGDDGRCKVCGKAAVP